MSPEEIAALVQRLRSAPPNVLKDRQAADAIEHLASITSRPAQQLSEAEIDALMPEADGSAEDNIVRNADGSYDFDEVPAWTRKQVHATVRAAMQKGNQ